MEFNGLPLHALLVHVVIVFVPLAALVALLSGLWAPVRHRLGVLPPVLALLAVIVVPINVQAGEWLFARVVASEQVQQHAVLGRTLLPWSLALLVACSLHWWWHRRAVVADPAPRRRPGSLPRAVTAVVLAAAVVATALGSLVTVVRIGESGTAAVWRDTYSPEPIEAESPDHHRE